METSKNTVHFKLDTLGAFLSLACAVHCLLMPLLVVALPMIGLAFLLDEVVEKLFAIFTVTFAGLSLCWGYRSHKKLRTLLLYLVGAGMILSALFVLPHAHYHDHHHVQDDFGGLFLLVIGSSLLVCSHLLNRHWCKHCVSCQTHKSSS